MSIGYACLTRGVPDTNQKTCIAKNATPDKLLELIDHNLTALDTMLDYNIKNKIKLFRISSDIIPFGSSPVNELAWESIFAKKLAAIGEKALNNGMRLSMHPGQYTVLNSPNEDVVGRAVLDLKYHNKFLDALGLPPSHKLILHIGGIYGNKSEAIDRFMVNYKMLPKGIKSRLIIENDDKLYTVHDVLYISKKMDIPVIFDNLHHQINFNETDIHSEAYWIKECAKTWKAVDGRQKTHYSQQDPGKRIGSHSSTIYINEFLDYYQRNEMEEVDIMLEVKDKNLSTVKCLNCVMKKPQIKYLEQEWSRYKYTVLERSPNTYKSIRNLLKDKASYPAIEFYNYLEYALECEPTEGNQINAAQHVWGYFKDVATEKEKASFMKTTNTPSVLKRMLGRLAVKYNREYLLQSYYFIL